MPRPRLDHVRKAQILTAAAAVLSERGYANARVVDIAKAAGTSPAAILYWFDGKHGLLAEALSSRELEFHDRYTMRIEHAATASEQLRILIEAMLHHYDWALWMELCVLALRDTAAAAERDRMDRRWRAMLRKVIRDGQQTRRVRRRRRRRDDVRARRLARRHGAAAGDEGPRASPQQRVERTWLAEAARLLGPGFDSTPLRRSADESQPKSLSSLVVSGSRKPATVASVSSCSARDEIGRRRLR